MPCDFERLLKWGYDGRVLLRSGVLGAIIGAVIGGVIGTTGFPLVGTAIVGAWPGPRSAP